ncbi:hypothetical protein ACIRD2_26455 [Streptomyces sp. NPDC093595]|uniref:hypothetical protein n=1 Tax=Streptomyces sp. NPDC093595 TaxID=3366045 RepID=UPI003814A9B5
MLLAAFALLVLSPQGAVRPAGGAALLTVLALVCAVIVAVRTVVSARIAARPER